MKENIKEDIKRISNLIEYIENADYVDASQCFDAEDIQAIDHIISDYKRVLKESEKYKNMYEAEHRIHLLRNEQLDKKQKAIIRCNELENIAKELQIKNEALKDRYNNDTHKLQNDLDIANAKIIELLKENEELKIKEFQLHLATEEMKSMIYKQKVKDKIEELNNVPSAEKYEDIMNEKNYTIIELVQYVLQELIEREEKV